MLAALIRILQSFPGFTMMQICFLGGRVVGTGLAEKLVHLFLTTEFEGGRHKDRVDLIMRLEKRDTE